MASADTPCTICLEPCGAGTAPVHALQCGHAFHVHCIVDWFRTLGSTHDQCPTCRDTPHAGPDGSVHPAPGGVGMLFGSVPGAVPRVVGQHIAFLNSQRDGWPKPKQRLYDSMLKAIRTSAQRAKDAKLASAKHRKRHSKLLRDERRLRSNVWKWRSKQLCAMRRLTAGFQVDRFIVREVRQAPPAAVD